MPLRRLAEVGVSPGAVGRDGWLVAAPPSLLRRSRFSGIHVPQIWWTRGRGESVSVTTNQSCGDDSPGVITRDLRL